MDWGDVPSWALVVVSSCALVLAALAARWSYRAFLTASAAATRADEARREAGERQQARLVAAWPISERETFQKAIERGVVGAAIRNASPMPIYNVEIVYRDEGAAWSAVRHLHMVAPSDEPQIFAGFDEETTTGTPVPERINKDGSVKLVPSAEMRVEISFADTLGRRWRRDDSGVLDVAS
ncbi:hypothetical protein [Planosporangium mesophilum]|uniref:Uncharacterized protein n=1 Tax=Planosporangium mesophilum TaxID=689768 RepID=A0A8J3TFL5_9ACTN|nr:hypothetical protein [Planosporangium mesophilum]NJC85523.1 hypothetical protein [Planosporangium mesophilum]GII24611.1 hypothetical protein Pme01_42080 [Planosporangium mesophilum]